MKSILDMLHQIYNHRRTIWALALRQVQDRYAGTLGGAVWAILHPLLLLMLFWVVFAQGFKMQGAEGMPFVLVLFCGLIPWMTFNEALTGSVNSVIGHAHLVKKIAFPTEVLPAVYLVAALITHAVLLIVLCVVLGWYGLMPGLKALLFFYYLGAMCVFVVGLSWLLAALNVFHRDIGQAMVIVLNMWFWATPIVWQIGMLPVSFRPYMELNPLNYVIEGYREAFLGIGPIRVDFGTTAFFWLIAVGVLLLGATVFRRLKPNFAEVL